MYLRHTTIGKDGKTLKYWRVVHSVRKGAKVFQETVTHVGELDAADCAKARLLARSITGWVAPPQTAPPLPLIVAEM